MAKPRARARVKRPPVQILVVVANIQMRTLKTEVEKEIGPSGQQSVALLAAFGVLPIAPENPEERVLSAPGRTHNRIRSPRPRRAVGGLPELLAR
ncbi:hypothetical protein R1flu_008537 [Riccia fluitans]|uniref:Uncharacterized protein n=1 Tax=Riccia fluitans TaxID=41844 RepID=A0ABD1YF38_9MARC